MIQLELFFKGCIVVVHVQVCRSWCSDLATFLLFFNMFDLLTVNGPVRAMGKINHTRLIELHIVEQFNTILQYAGR